MLPLLLLTMLAGIELLEVGQQIGHHAPRIGAQPLGRAGPVAGEGRPHYLLALTGVRAQRPAQIAAQPGDAAVELILQVAAGLPSAQGVDQAA